jgi:hypothetical protein
MVPSVLHRLVFFLFIATSISAQSSAGSGYTGYSLSVSGDADSVIYSTSSHSANVSTTVPEPDVYLNATVHVGEIDLNVSNLTAKINLGAQVLQLLQFNAGVDVSIDRVTRVIANVSAKVLLEARLANLVLMINDTLNSLDLNPVLATLGQDVGNLVNTTANALTGGIAQTSTLSARSYELANNILYSTNDYSGNTHANRILTQSGSIIDQFLDNNGNTRNQQLVGSYLRDMTFSGYNQTVVVNGQVASELEYVYMPFDGLSVVSAIYISPAGTVVGTQVLSESSGGGSSTVGGQ